MSDPLDGVLDGIDPNAPPITTADPVTPPDTTTSIDKAELERLQQIAAQFNEVAPTLQMFRDNPNLLNDMRARLVEQTTPPQPNPADADTEFWQNPAQSTQRIAQQVAAQQTHAMSAQLGEMVIQNFKNAHQTDPFYHVAMPGFDKLMGQVNRAQFGALNPEGQKFLLDSSWNSAVGEYSRKTVAERKKNPPANLGGGASGGASGGGPKVKRSLQEIDPGVYAQATMAGLSEADMQEIADTYGEE